jgi:hypothetical protein
MIPDPELVTSVNSRVGLDLGFLMEIKKVKKIFLFIKKRNFLPERPSQLKEK